MESGLVQAQTNISRIPNIFPTGPLNHVLPFDDEKILILNPIKNNMSVFFDMATETIEQSRLPYDTRGSEYVGLVNFRQWQNLYNFDVAERPGFDIVSRRQQHNANPNVFSRLAATSLGSTMLHDLHAEGPSSARAGIYMIGGRDKNTNKIKKNVEFFNFLSLTWRPLPPMFTGRRGAAAAVVGGKLVVIGGFVWDRVSFRYRECPYTEVFDGTSWSFGPSLNIARENHSAVVVGDSSTHGNMIVVLGGTTSNGEQIDQVEVWNLETNSFVVVPNFVVPAADPRRTMVFDAFVYQKRNVYLVREGYPKRIDKVTFDLPLLSQYTLLNATTTSAVAPSAPPAEIFDPLAGLEQLEQESTTTAVSAQQTAATTDLGAASTNKLLQGTTTTTTKDQSISSWLPNPPVLPPPPMALTLRDRNKAMAMYIQSLESTQERYRQTIEESEKKIVEYYDRLRDHQIDLTRFHGTSWLGDVEELIQHAKQDMELQEKLLQKSAEHQKTSSNPAAGQQQQQITAATITTKIPCVHSFLQQNDQDQFYDNVPSQLRCPLTLDLMTDPVVAADGNMYEKSALEEWFHNSRMQQEERNNSGRTKKMYIPRSPLTGAELANEKYIPVHTLRSMCRDYAEKLKKNGTIKEQHLPA